MFLYSSRVMSIELSIFIIFSESQCFASHLNSIDARERRSQLDPSLKYVENEKQRRQRDIRHDS